MKKHYLLLLLFVISLQTLQAQQISNVVASLTTDQKKIAITYDILNAEAGQKFDIKLYVSKDGGSWQQIYSSSLTGDYGKYTATTTGSIRNRRIVYNPLYYNERLQANVKFKIKTDVTSAFSNYTEQAGYTSFDMVAVKGGTFSMGSNESSDEKPIHQVSVSNFYIGKYEVTQKLWKEIMGTNPSSFKGDNLPVEKVSWNDIQEFLVKLNRKTGKTYRLPTEAEWEYAAGASASLSNRYKYAGTNSESSLGTYAWYYSNSGSKTHNVGTKRANALGIYDMSGNVWEWCQDKWHDDYTGAPTNGKAWTSGSSSNRVNRGGSWYGITSYCRVAYRYGNGPSYRNNNLGFRLVLVP